MIGEDSLVENGYDFECIGVDIVSFFIEPFFFFNATAVQERSCWQREVVLPVDILMKHRGSLSYISFLWISRHIMESFIFFFYHEH